jgi:hypothetical protein
MEVTAADSNSGDVQEPRNPSNAAGDERGLWDNDKDEERRRKQGNEKEQRCVVERKDGHGRAEATKEMFLVLIFNFARSTGQ